MVIFYRIIFLSMNRKAFLIIVHLCSFGVFFTRYIFIGYHPDTTIICLQRQMNSASTNISLWKILMGASLAFLCKSSLETTKLTLPSE